MSEFKLQVKDIAKFPVLVGLLLWKTLYHSLTEVETFLLVVVSALLGYKLGWIWGAIIFCGVYLAFRMVGGYVGLLASKLDFIGSAISRGGK